MAGHDGLDDREAHSGATGVATGGEEGVDDLLAVRLSYRIAVIAHRHPDNGGIVDGHYTDMLRIVTNRIVGQVRQHDQRLLAGHADRTFETVGGVSGNGSSSRRSPAAIRYVR